jgi:FlaA1/EpsC-like NDP-sugar epimerase
MTTAARPALRVPQSTAPGWTAVTIFFADVVALEASFVLGLLTRRLLSSIFTASIGPGQYLGIAAGILLMPAVYYQVGLYPGYLLGPVERLRRRTLATLAVFGGLVAWDNLVSRGVFSRGVLVATLLFALILPPLAETLARRTLVRRGKWGIPVVLLGSGDAGRTLVRTLRREPELGLQPVAFLDNRPGSWNTAVEEVPVLGPLNLADTLEHRAQAAIVLLADLGAENLADLLQDLNFPRIIVIPDRAGIAGLWVSARDVGGQLGL